MVPLPKMVSPPSNPTKDHNCFNGNLLEFWNATCQVIYMHVIQKIIIQYHFKKLTQKAHVSCYVIQ
jgi:hypothetical protein